MLLLRRLLIIGMVLFLIIGKAQADHVKNDFYRNFWSPQYHARFLDYCSCNNTICGKPVADRYCRKMGYKMSDKHIKEYNVGMTYTMDSEGSCVGWQCHGFKMIRCVADLPNSPPKIYSYRKKEFSYPRLNHYRVDWCYQNSKGCGRKAANSFCRRLGYMKATHYEMEKEVPSTRDLGNQELCFGKKCSGFKKIICYR